MDPRTILNTLKEASPFDLFLISFLLLPFIFEAWLGVLNSLELALDVQYWSLCLILLLYIVGVIAMLLGSQRAQQRERARDIIVQYLTLKGLEMVSFDRIRNNINSSYSNNFLETLPSQFPNQIRKAKLKGAKPGLARIIESQSEDEE